MIKYKLCENCNTKFILTIHNRKFCDECIPLIYKAFYELNNILHQRKHIKHICLACDSIFYADKRFKFCKDCSWLIKLAREEYGKKQYHNKHKEERKEWEKKYRQENKEKLKIASQISYHNRPWAKFFSLIKSRCNYEWNDTYDWYGGKGIKCLLTLKDLKFLWFRDGADKMIKPSIHRKESNKDYTIENCEFIEFKEHVNLHHIERMKHPITLFKQEEII